MRYNRDLTSYFMDTNTLLLLFLVLLSIGGIAFLYFRSKQTDTSQASQNVIEELRRIQQDAERLTFEHRKEVQDRLDRVHDELSRNLMQSQTSLQEQFKQVNDSDAKMRQTIQTITEALTDVKSTNKQVLDFSGQLQDLQNILKNPKQRGVLGEYWLETLLRNVLPANSYQMQYTIGSDENSEKKLIADACIFIRDHFVAIDAKFSLENYNRMMTEKDAVQREKLEKAFKADTKMRIDETAKYIKPELGTLNFAFMFIPAEGVYYNLMNAEIGSGINSNSLVEYAFSKHVMIVSPTSFYAYLQTVLLGLRELQLEESTQQIIKQVGELGKHFRAFSDYHDRLGKNLGTVVNQYNQSNQELRKMTKDVVKITSGSADDVIDVDNVVKPLIED